MAALRWFMDNHTSFNQTLKDLCLRLANFVLTNNYVQCKELGGDIYHQHIGTAMGTSFSVVYAVIFMIHLESPILEDPRFRSFIQLYKRFIDDIFLIWTGSAATRCEFLQTLGSADDTIKLDWGGYEITMNSRRKRWITQWLRQNTMIEQNFWTSTFAWS